MTYDPIDTNDDGTVNADVDNQSVNAEDLEGDNAAIDTAHTNKVTRRDTIEGNRDQRYAYGGETLDTFTDLDDWEEVAGDATIDTDEYARGESSVRIEADEWDNCRIEREFDDPIDLSNKRPSFAVKCLYDTDSSRRIDIRAEDADGEWVRFRHRYRYPDEDNYPGWRRFTPGIYDFSDDDESVDWSNIVKLRLMSSGEDLTVWFDDLRLTPAPDPALITIDLDDAPEEDYEYGVATVSEYGWPCTIFTVSNYIEDRDDHLDLDQLEELRDKYGIEAGNHTANHNEDGDSEPETQEEEVREAKEWLIENGFERGAEHFLARGHDHNQSYYEIQQRHASTATVVAPIGGGVANNPYYLNRVTADDGLGDESEGVEVRDALDWLAHYGGVGGVVFHSHLTDEETMREVLDRIKHHEERGRLRVVTKTDLFERSQELLRSYGSEDVGPEAPEIVETFNYNDEPAEIDLPDASRVEIQFRTFTNGNCELQFGERDGDWLTASDDYEWGTRQDVWFDDDIEAEEEDDDRIRIVSDQSDGEGQRAGPITLTISDPHRSSHQTQVETRGTHNRGGTVRGHGMTTDQVSTDRVRLLSDAGDSDEAWRAVGAVVAYD